MTFKFHLLSVASGLSFLPPGGREWVNLEERTQ